MKHQLALPWNTHSHNPLPELGLAERVTHNAPRHLAATAALPSEREPDGEWLLAFLSVMWSVSLAGEHMPSSQVILETALRVFLQISTQTANTPFTREVRPKHRTKSPSLEFLLSWRQRSICEGFISSFGPVTASERSIAHQYPQRKIDEDNSVKCPQSDGMNRARMPNCLKVQVPQLFLYASSAWQPVSSALNSGI